MPHLGFCPGKEQGANCPLGSCEAETHQLQQLIQSFTEDSKSLLTGKGLQNRGMDLK